MTQNERNIQQAGKDIEYFKKYANATDPANRNVNGKTTKSYKNTVRRMEYQQQLDILKERNITS